MQKVANHIQNTLKTPPPPQKSSLHTQHIQKVGTLTFTSGVERDDSQLGRYLTGTCEGWSGRSQWRTDIKRISKTSYPFMSSCKATTHLMGLSDDFDGGRIKERRGIDGPVPVHT